jgi:glucan phosphorylase
MMKESIRTLGPMFSTARMLKEYATDMYVPAALNRPVED